MTSRQLSYLVAICIILYGIFGKQLWPDFQLFVEILLPDDLSSRLAIFLQGKEISAEDQWSLGRYLVYYPIYLLLHLLLINVIFWHSAYQKLANMIFIGILMALIGGSLIFHLIHWTFLYDAVMNVTVTFLNLPLILFIVEGGRILLDDIDRKLGGE